MTQQEMIDLREQGLAMIDNGSYEEGLKLLFQADEAGDLQAPVFIGCHYDDEVKDAKQACKWYDKAIDRYEDAGQPDDNAKTVWLIGYTHQRKGEMYDDDCQYFMAYIEYCMAQECGINEVLYRMGEIAYDGYTTADGEPDVNLALDYWRQGMEVGDTDCEKAYQEHLEEEVPEMEDPQEIDFENGDHYEGEVNDDGLPDGYGVMTYEKQSYHTWMNTQLSFDTYKGQWKNGKREGVGRMTYYMNGNGSVTYSGEWLDGEPHGKGTFKKYGSVTDETYTGEWEHGKRHGQGHYYEHWDKGTFPTTEYDGEWQHDREHGHGTCSYAYPYSYSPKDVYDGEWCEGRRQGQGKMTYKTGDVYEGSWVNGNCDGHGKITKADGSWYEGEWKDGQLLMDTIVSSDGSDVPLLKLRLYSHGFDYSNSSVCMVKAKKGDLSHAKVTMLAGPELSDNARKCIRVLSVDHDMVSYEVAGVYFKDFKPRTDSIRRGEEKEYKHETEETATIYDEDYDYTVCRQLNIACY